jgi:hypothetical protein
MVRSIPVVLHMFLCCAMQCRLSMFAHKQLLDMLNMLSKKLAGYCLLLDVLPRI